MYICALTFGSRLSCRSRKRKSSISAEAPLEAEGVSTELAVGTASGSVIIYSTKTAKCDERSLHSDVVNDLVRPSPFLSFY